VEEKPEDEVCLWAHTCKQVTRPWETHTHTQTHTKTALCFTRWVFALGIIFQLAWHVREAARPRKRDPHSKQTGAPRRPAAWEPSPVCFKAHNESRCTAGHREAPVLSLLSCNARTYRTFCHLPDGPRHGQRKTTSSDYLKGGGGEVTSGARSRALRVGRTCQQGPEKLL